MASVQVCPKDYLPSLLKWIDLENIPRYLGGTSDATLIDDAGPWNDPQIRAEIEEDIAQRDGSGGQLMTPIESPQASTSARSTPQGLLQAPMSNGHQFSHVPDPVPFVRGPQALGVPAIAQQPSPFAAQSQQYEAFDADAGQVCVCMLVA